MADSRRRPRYLAVAALVGGIAVAGVAGRSIPAAGTFLAFANLASALVVVLLFVAESLPVAGLAALALGLSLGMTGVGTTAALAIGTAHAAGYLLVGVALRRTWKGYPGLSQGHDLAAVVVVALVGPAVAGLLALAVARLLGAAPITPVAIVAQSLGTLALAPVLLLEAGPWLAGSGQTDRRRFWRGYQVPVAVALAIVVVAVDVHPITAQFRTSFLLLLPSVWLAVTRGVRGAAIGNLVTTVAFVVAALLTGDPQSLRFADQIFLVALSLASLSLAKVTEAHFAAARRADQSERRYRLLADFASDLVTVQTPNGSIEYVSPSVTSQLGFPPEELVGTSIRALMHPADLAADRLPPMPLQPGEARQVSFRVRRKDGSYVWMEHAVRAMPARDRDDGVQWVVVSRDISIRRQLEEELHQSQKLESIGRLAGGIAHDFNNLLTAILGHSSLIEDDGEVAQDLRTQVGEIRKAAERAAGLTNQLLAFARRQVTTPKDVDLNDLVKGMDRLLKRELGPEIRLTMDLERGLWPVRVDPGQFEQVLLNLVVNARDAMPKGGTVTLSTRNRGRAEARPLPPTLAPGDYVEASVRDDGHGMPPEILARIFEPFFTSKPVGKGTGLGLAVCHGIVRQGGGEIVAESTVGVGTTFRILLGKATIEKAPARPRSAGGETLLIAEDDPQVRNLAGMVLRGAGFQVLEAADGTGALAAARASAVPIAALISDVVMPDMAGPRLAEQLAAEMPGMKFLFVSGFPERVAEELKTSTAYAFLMKPFTPQDLIRRVRDLLDEAPQSEVGLAQLMTDPDFLAKR